MWRAAIRKELKKMEDHKVWILVNKSKMMKENRKAIKNKWIFEIKRSGIFRSRLVACGYSQIPGIDFTDIYSPVMCDTTMRILLIVVIVKGYVTRILDIETAFLHGILKEGEQVYMQVPAGVTHEQDEVILLIKTIYGLVQSARAFFMLLVKVLKELGFTQSPADPCLFTRRGTNGQCVYIGIYVDDLLIVGDQDAVNKCIRDIKTRFNVTVEESLSDYLSCEIQFNSNRTKAWIGQPHLIKRLEKHWGEEVKTLQKFKTPGTPSLGVLRPKEGDVLLGLHNQKHYRSGVGLLLYLVKHSRPDIANPVRELSKCNDKASPAAYKELLRVIKFVLDTKTLGLKIEPKTGILDVLDHKSSKSEGWVVYAYTDSDWAGDKDNRISVSGFVVFLHGVPILWKSKQQRSVASSSSEAEYYSLSEAAKEIKFIAQTLLTMGLKVTLPIIVRVDNIGAIFMAENASAMSRTKHVDLRYHFLREYVEEGFLRIIFVRTANNVSDGFTKNVTADTHINHMDHFVAKREWCRDNTQIQRKGVGVMNRE